MFVYIWGCCRPRQNRLAPKGSAHLMVMSQQDQNGGIKLIQVAMSEGGTAQFKLHHKGHLEKEVKKEKKQDEGNLMTR